MAEMLATESSKSNHQEGESLPRLQMPMSLMREGLSVHLDGPDRYDRYTLRPDERFGSAPAGSEPLRFTDPYGPLQKLKDLIATDKVESQYLDLGK